MSKTIELSLNAAYLPEWNVWDGVRELMSNGRDAEVQFNAPLTVKHTGDKLVIENDGTTIPHEALLFGTTTKRDDTNTIGRFGEGLKLGCLALVRGGHEVTIRSGSEVWTPIIRRSEKFKADVLAFEIATGRQERDRVRVEVAGISKETWQELQTRFLFLLKLKDKEQVNTEHGRLLRGERFAGKVYLKGIWVQNLPSEYGYDFTDATIDRDRKMIASWDMEWKTARIWQAAAVTRPDLMKTFLDLVEKGDDQVKTVRSFSEPAKEVVAAAAARFAERHGDKAVPVKNLGESQEVAHLGRRGVVVHESLASLLQRQMGTLDQMKQSLATEVVTMYSWDDLTAEEKANLTWAVTTLAKVREGVDLSQVDIVDFRGPFLGMYNNGRWQIARKELADSEEFLATLIHERAHKFGGDGDGRLLAEIEASWRDIVKAMRKDGGAS